MSEREVTYTAEMLRRMKRDHETAYTEELRKLSAFPNGPHDLIGVGPAIICTGELLGVSGSDWSLHTPLQSVERVHGIEATGTRSSNH
jgi:hypothetical protein